MKNVTIILFSLSILAKPLYPIAEYIVNYNYIVNNLCENRDKPALNCDGKCYLSKLLAKESKESEENPFGEKQSQTEVQHIFFYKLSAQIDFGEDLLQGAKDNFKFVSLLISTPFVSEISEPPEVS
ncbi:hypothetical protein DKG77_16485 [Flagellimonas aquimarina]|uniref:Uncharacterized protein n=1 Tax=Flagellimonas aquimarina TaxID=2201895 RepID=A0A316KX41_9FLAO|nr:hypothetical protein [Allomuricauda koreensis]PWL37365.1 hypothetical protein DKG77_16485 [Allomuricauda koreensis]